MEVERATGVAQQPCWCTQVDFSVDLFERVPANARRLACVCRSCAEKAAPMTHAALDAGSSPA
jgi:hypothetical protein